MSAATHPNAAAFSEGLRIIFNNWWVLKTAVEYGWGGHDSEAKAEWFISSMVDYFGANGKKVDIFEIEDVVSQVMNQEFQTVFEDDSASDVAKELYELFQTCIRGDYTKLEELRRLYPAATKLKTISLSDDDDDDDDDDEAESSTAEEADADGDMDMMDADPPAPAPAPVADPDGWEPVTNRRGRR
ncbi:rRNA accumulation- protein [Sorochytrium milnesiophthora]